MDHRPRDGHAARLGRAARVEVHLTRWLWAALAFYAGVYVVAPPRALLIVDEERYVAQSVAFAEGARAIAGAERRFDRIPHAVMSDYPPGTSLWQTPFVAIGGWRYAGLASVVALVLATIFTAHALRHWGRDARFALLVPAFAGAAFFARVGMSDVPSAAVIAAGLWCFARAEHGDRWAMFGGGVFAGLSLLFRELNVVLLLPLVGGVMLRRTPGWQNALVGLVLGLAARPLVSWAVFGAPWYVRDSLYGFSFSHVVGAAPLWLFILMVLFPGALVLPALFRGARRTELITAVVLYFALYLSYGYDAIEENGLLKGTLLTSRYAVPALPLLVVMAAEVWPRLAARLGERVHGLLRWAPAVGAGAVVVIGSGAQLAARAQERVAVAIIEPLFVHSNDQLPLVVNEKALSKYVSPIYGRRAVVLRRDVDSVAPARIATTETFTVAMFDRDDSEMFRRDGEENGRFLARLESACAVVSLHDSRPAAWGRLRIFSVTDCREAD